MRMTVHTTPRMIIILQFFHQYFLFSLAALVSNCEAPACNASARLSSSESFWSLSNTLSTFILMMSTTSSTWACVCCSRLLLDTLVAGGGPAAPVLVGPWVGAGADMAPDRRCLRSRKDGFPAALRLPAVSQCCRHRCRERRGRHQLLSMPVPHITE